MSESLVFLSESLICSFAHKNKQFALKKTKKSYFCMFLQFFKKDFLKTKDSLIPSEPSERIAQVGQDK